jgi:hypothetical protein
VSTGTDRVVTAGFGGAVKWFIEAVRGTAEVQDRSTLRSTGTSQAIVALRSALTCWMPALAVQFGHAYTRPFSSPNTRTKSVDTNVSQYVQ